MARDIVEASQCIDSLLQQLPQAFGTEEEELQRIDGLQTKRAAICREVQDARDHAEQALQEVQTVHGSITDRVLAAPETALQGLEHR